jgi:hypothetical protein
MGDLNRAIAGSIGMTNGTAEVKKFGCESKQKPPFQEIVTNNNDDAHVT